MYIGNIDILLVHNCVTVCIFDLRCSFGSQLMMGFSDAVMLMDCLLWDLIVLVHHLEWSQILHMYYVNNDKTHPPLPPKKKKKMMIFYEVLFRWKHQLRPQVFSRKKIVKEVVIIF